MSRASSIDWQTAALFIYFLLKIKIQLKQHCMQLYTVFVFFVCFFNEHVEHFLSFVTHSKTQSKRKEKSTPGNILLINEKKCVLHYRITKHSNHSPLRVFPTLQVTVLCVMTCCMIKEFLENLMWSLVIIYNSFKDRRCVQC